MITPDGQDVTLRKQGGQGFLDSIEQGRWTLNQDGTKPRASAHDATTAPSEQDHDTVSPETAPPLPDPGLFKPTIHDSFEKTESSPEDTPSSSSDPAQTLQNLSLELAKQHMLWR